MPGPHPGLSVVLSVFLAWGPGELDALFLVRGMPRTIVCDNWPEFVSLALDRWASARGVAQDLIRPGRPVECSAGSKRGGRSTIPTGPIRGSLGGPLRSMRRCLPSRRGTPHPRPSDPDVA